MEVFSYSAFAGESETPGLFAIRSTRGKLSRVQGVESVLRRRRTGAGLRCVTPLLCGVGKKVAGVEVERRELTRCSVRRPPNLT
jgi:hypothetical protein